MFKRVKLILRFYNVKETSIRCIVNDYVSKYIKFIFDRKGKKRDDTDYGYDNIRYMFRTFSISTKRKVRLILFFFF